MEWFRRLAAWLGGTCRHKWVKEQDIQVRDHKTLALVGRRYHLRCVRCGWLEERYFGN